jgi:hypothetical protein
MEEVRAALARITAADLAGWADRARARWTVCGGRAAPPDETGRFAEAAMCAVLGAVPWPLLPVACRRLIHGGGSPADHGIDAVAWRPPGGSPDGKADGPGLVFYQMKHCEASRVGFDAVAKLVALANEFEKREGCRVGCRLALGGATELAAGVPLAYRAGIDRVPFARMLEATDGALRLYFAGGRLVEAAPAALPAVYEAEQAAAAGRLLACARRGSSSAGVPGAGVSVVSGRYPVGFGKTGVMIRLVAAHREAARATGHPWSGAVVVAPRVEIVRQLAAAFGAAGFATAAVAEGADWQAAGWEVAVVCGASARKIPEGTQADPAVFDEADYELGCEAARQQLRWTTAYRLSATLPGPVNDAVPHALAVALGLICDALIEIRALSAEPAGAGLWDAVIAALRDRSRGPRECALVSFQREARARAFAAYARARGLAIESYTELDGDSGGLDRLRRGEIQALAVVTRVCRGVNVHRCDAVVLVEPWGSEAMLHQLCGRACRRFGDKRRYTVVAFAYPDAARVEDGAPGSARAGGGAEPGAELTARRVVARLIQMLRDTVPGLAERDRAEALLRKFDVVPAGAAGEPGPVASRAAELVRVLVFDALGALLGSEAERLRARYLRDIATLRGAALAAPAALAAFRAARPELGLPADPPEAYRPLFGDAFDWAEYLSRPAALTSHQEINAAATDAAAALIGEGYPSERFAQLDTDTYELIRQHCPRLPCRLESAGMRLEWALRCGCPRCLAR